MTLNLCNGLYRVADFDTESDGTTIPVGAYVDGEGLYDDWGLTLTAIGAGNVATGPNTGQPRRMMTFPSESPTYAGPDTDLINIGSGLGNILIISDNNQGPDQGDPENTMEDANTAGTFSLTWDRRVEILEFTVIDADILATNAIQGYADVAGTIPVGLNVVIQTVDSAIQVIDIRNTPFIQRLDFSFGVGEGIAVDNITWRECLCPVGQVRDCADECGVTANNIIDCAGTCYPSGTPPPNICDCAGTCYPRDDPPPSVPDCNGVCGGDSVIDCNGVCDGNAVLDCSDVCDGDAFVDCGGNCIICLQSVMKCECFYIPPQDEIKWNFL